MVHFWCVSQEDNHDPQVQYRLWKEVEMFFISLINQRSSKLHFSNTHHVQDNENSGHRIAPQEDTQSDAEITVYINHWGSYLKQEANVIKVQSWWGGKNIVKCYLKRSMVLAALRTLPYTPGLSWSLKRIGVFLCRAPEKITHRKRHHE